MVNDMHDECMIIDAAHGWYLILLKTNYWGRINV